MKQAHEELQGKAAEEIIQLKKEQDRLVVKKAQLCASCGMVEQVVDEACQHIYKITMKLTAFSKAKQLGEVIAQLQLTNNLLNSLVYPEMPPE